MKKKKRQAAHRRDQLPFLSVREYHRLFVCRSVEAVLTLAIGHAIRSGDKDLTASMERVSALLDHEVTHFLKLPTIAWPAL